MSYARVLDDAIASTSPPPDLLEPDDVTAENRWWDLRQHDYDLSVWETEIIGPHGWLAVATTARPPDTASTTSDYSLVLVDGVPTEVWTERPWTPAELDAQAAQANVTQMTAEQDESVDKLILVVENLNLITDMTNSEINANPAAIIKDVARELKTVARVANREARMTSGRTEDTDTGAEVPEADPVADPAAFTIAQIEDWVDNHPDAADEVLAAETGRGSAARSTLISWLQGFIAHRDDE
jgi:hypothetical protein